ncbi:hypothetical protein MMC24_004172 [Lignoscripta atroalba]|nr:hypothetical protein [Lignoscripta atroalba]
MDPHHRKIDLQSPQDLNYLLSNIKAAAQQKLDLHISPSADPKGEDPFRTKVEELVHQYIHQTLSLALPSLSINGLDASPSLLTPPPSLPLSKSSDPTTAGEEDDPNYEPYDTRLAGKLRTLYATLESETTRVAELRREAPAAAARAYVERLKDEMGAEERNVEAMRERALRVGREEGAKGLRDVKIAREDVMLGSWERGLEGLSTLSGLTEAVARLERAKEVVGVVEGM